MTYCSDDLLNSNFYIIVVPTPIDSKNKPDLSCLFYFQQQKPLREN